jgi:hypothetical protein
VTYDHGDEIDACLDGALAQAGPQLDVDIVVVDNASHDDTVERVRVRDRVRLVELGSNRGFASGMNVAFAACEGEHVLILNPDCVMEPGCAAALLEHLRSRPQVALAAALLHDPDGTPQLFARRDLDLRGALWAFTTLGRRLDAGVRGGRARATRRYEELWADGAPRDPVAVFCPAAACVMAARTDLLPAPFDERFPLFFNDGDLCARLSRAGGRRAEVVPAARAAHGYGTSVGRAQRSDPARMRAEWVASLRCYAARWWGRPARAVLPALLLADAAVAAALCVMHREDPREVRGTLGGLGLPGGPPPLLTPVRRWGRRPA